MEDVIDSPGTVEAGAHVGRLIQRIGAITRSDSCSDGDNVQSIFETMQAAVLAEGPFAYFHMMKGGIRIFPPVHRWSPAGFTFACWISPILDCQESLFCFSGDGGTFIGATISAGGRLRLVSASSPSSKLRMVETADQVLFSGRWQFLSIHLVRARRTALLSKKTRIEIMVDMTPAVFSQHKDFDFPKIQALTDAGIGCLCDAVYTRLPDTSHFSGCLGAIYIFNNRISSGALLTSIYEMGVDYIIPSMSEPVAENLFVKFSSSFSGRNSENLRTNFVFAFHPRATEANFCTDISPTESDTGATRAVLFKRSRAFVFSRLCDWFVIRSCILLPVLEHMHLLPAERFDVHAAVIQTLLFVLMRPLLPTQSKMSDLADFFNFSGQILLHVDPKFISRQSADAYQQLVLQLWQKQEELPEIVAAVSSHLLRLDWWNRAGVDPTAQLFLAETCRTIILSQRHTSIFSNDAPTIFERIEAYVPGTDDTSMRVRHLLLTAIMDMNESQFLDIIGYLDDSKHALHSAQFIELLAAHISTETPSDSLRSFLDASLAACLQHTSSHQVLIASFHCINICFEFLRLEPSLSFVTTMILPHMVALLAQKKLPLLDSILYRSFLELFLRNCPPGTVGTANVIGWCFCGNSVNSHFLLPDIHNVVKDKQFAHVIVLFAALRSFPDAEMLLGHISRILELPDNRDALLSEQLGAWQSPLFSLISWKTDEFHTNRLNSIVFDVVQVVLCHGLFYRANATPIIRETLSYLRLSVPEQEASTVNLERVLFSGMIVHMLSAGFDLFGVSTSHSFKRNICSFGDLIEEEAWCRRSIGIRRRSSTASPVDSPYHSYSALSADGVLLSPSSSDGWLLCNDEVDDPARSLSPADIVGDLPHMLSLIDIVVRWRLPLYMMETTGEPHRLNLMQVLLSFLGEAIAIADNADIRSLATQVVALVDMASSDTSSLPGTNAAVVLFLQRMCTLQNTTAEITKLCSDIIAIFSPFIAIQAHHYGDPAITELLATALADRRFGELQLPYIHSSTESALTMVMPPITDTIYCIPIDISPSTHSFTVHPHIAHLIIANDATSVEGLIFSALNEMVKCEQSLRAARFADCLRYRCRLEGIAQAALLHTNNVVSSEEILSRRVQRIRRHADNKARRRILQSMQERFNEMSVKAHVKLVKHIMSCSNMAIGPVSSSEMFWSLPAASCSRFARNTLDPFLTGSQHTQATHTYLMQSYANRLTTSNEVVGAEADAGFALSKDLVLSTNPIPEADWDLCEVYDDEHIPDSEAIFHRPSIVIDATLVTPLVRVKGSMRLDNQSISFEPLSLEEPSDGAVKKRHHCPELEFDRADTKRPHQWSLHHLCSAHRRRYQLQHSAMEFFFDTNESMFLDFPTPDDRARVAMEVALLKPPNLDPLLMGTPWKVLRKFNATRKWQRREISNFEYLSTLNNISGRTFQDLNQYPIFPWVLSDYTSEKIDLHDFSVYRDLSKPIGAQTDAQTALLAERYEHFIGSSIPPFHFGSHYSNTASVIFFLLRLEPFSSLHIELQDGRFDFPDRLFSSVAQTYSVCTTNRSSVKELVPEFFTLPEMFMNCNGFDLGVRQTGDVVGDVVLPPWAENDPHTFVRINREALESEYVSSNLPYWIDLIWGYKQRGSAAVDAFNVFYHLSYEGQIDIDAVVDPLQRDAIRSQISQWGQVPIQLFNKPHVHRDPIVIPPLSLQPNLETMPIKTMRISEGMDPLESPGICDLTVVNSKIIMAITEDHTTNQLAFTINPTDNRITLHPVAITLSRTKLAIPTHPNSEPLPDCIVWSSSGRYCISGNHWDGSVRLYRFALQSSSTGSANPFLKLASYTLVQSIRAHSGRINCLAVSKCRTMVVSGSIDYTLMVWSVTLDESLGKPVRISEVPERVLIGHELPVVCVAIDSAMNICASCSGQPLCLLHRLHNGHLIRKISLVPAPHSIPLSVFISPLGYLCFGARAADTDVPAAPTSLLTYSVNGTLLQAMRVQGDPIGVVLCISHSGCLVALANLGRITIYRIHDLTVVQSCHNISLSFTSISFSANDEAIIGGSEDGKILVYPIEIWSSGTTPDALRPRASSDYSIYR